MLSDARRRSNAAARGRAQGTNAEAPRAPRTSAKPKSLAMLPGWAPPPRHALRAPATAWTAAR
eukprot:CAMPEP_0198439874 /NCGR_PEP_ID=MMETSP1452-20131203/56607_1 /TAXON_ID=1181717 /ORGANISM="Synchroma pusillum, Strain CCMP3072" /LENGTH=62 /DNA_ID=CAMNT_0044160485 /DNA_START=66 /DNA_END=251 /DNA_ORIENTATION=-